MKSDPPQITVREARPDDRAFLLKAAERLSSFPLPAWRTREEVVAADVRTLDGFLASAPSGSRLLIAEAGDGTPLGFIFLETMEDYFTQTRHGHVGIVAVTEEAEGRGVGRILLEAAEAWAREQGFTRLSLNVFEENRRARAVYEHFGYAPETLRYLKVL
jgi:GNAT superfamily N-acetyltransferase